jgi:acyl carrier protein
MSNDVVGIDELRAAVLETVNTSAIPPRDPGESLTEDMRLANIGIDSLGMVMLLLELSTRTGLSFERRNGMAPLRTVGDILEFGRQLLAQPAQ